MHASPAGTIIAALLMLMLCRSLFGGEVSIHQSAKARNRYKTEVPFLRRWLLLDAPRYVRNKYSKLERKVINATLIARMMRGMNLTLHVLLLVVITAALMADDVWRERILLGYVLICGGCIIILSLMEWAFHPNRERARYGKKPRNW